MILLTDKPILEISSDNSQEGRRLYFYEQGEEIPLVTKGVWQVYRGLVQLSTFHLSGEEVLLGWADPAMCFGNCLTSRETYQAKALTDVYLKWFSLSEIEADPSLAYTFLTHLSRRMRQSEALLAIAGIKRVEARLHQFLSLLKGEMGEPVEAGTRLTIRLTHQSIANAIGTTRVTVTRLLGKLQRQGYISLDGDRHIILKER